MAVGQALAPRAAKFRVRRDSPSGLKTVCPAFSGTDTKSGVQAFKMGDTLLDPPSTSWPKIRANCFLPEALASSKSLADVHSCFRLIVVSHPGPARPRTDADSSRREHDSRRRV